MSNITDSGTNKLHKILITLFLVYMAISRATTLNILKHLHIRIILSSQDMFQDVLHKCKELIISAWYSK